jgi:hypothetical protein
MVKGGCLYCMGIAIIVDRLPALLSRVQGAGRMVLGEEIPEGCEVTLLWL